MAEKFSLKDHLFNPTTVAQLGAEYAAGIDGFDAVKFQRDALGGFAKRELLERMEWMADCLEGQLASDFPTMADQLEAAMPGRLSPNLCDDDFGHFIHGLPGILAVRHGLEDYFERAMDLLYAATQRFSMEFYIRAFLNRWPDETLARLADWANDENYHVRRLVSEGTRPKLPWAKSVSLETAQTVPLLTRLHSDPTRYVSRSVSNHLNDIAKNKPDLVVSLLKEWSKQGKQDAKELAWMTRHSLRTLVKQGHEGALELLGFSGKVPVTASLELGATRYVIGDRLRLSCTLRSNEALPVMVDYRLIFARPNGKSGEKVFKLKVGEIVSGKPLELSKAHHLKGDATTFKLHAGAHRVVLQVNGNDVAEAAFDLLPAL